MSDRRATQPRLDNPKDWQRGKFRLCSGQVEEKLWLDVLGIFHGERTMSLLDLGKECGFITSDSYCQTITTPIDSMVSMRPWTLVILDNAPPHVVPK